MRRLFHVVGLVVDFLLHPIFRIAVAGLDPALELLAVAIDLRQIINREVTPLLFDLAAALCRQACRFVG